MRILFIHQNFPGQFKLLANHLAQQKGFEVVGMGDAANLETKPRTTAFPVLGYRPGDQRRRPSSCASGGLHPSRQPSAHSGTCPATNRKRCRRHQTFQTFFDFRVKLDCNWVSGRGAHSLLRRVFVSNTLPYPAPMTIGGQLDYRRLASADFLRTNGLGPGREQ